MGLVRASVQGPPGSSGRSRRGKGAHPRWTRTIRLPALGTLLLGWGAWPSPPAAAQGFLSEGRMEVSLPPEAGPVPVVLEYRLAPEPGAREVGVTLLSPRGVRLTGLQASGPEGEIPFQLQEIRPHYWTGSMGLPETEEAPLIRIGYRVEGGWSGDGRITLPIPAVAWVPSEPGPRTFVAAVEVPAGLTVRESFPTSVTRKPRGPEGGVYEVSLQAVPAMLVLRVARGRSPHLGLEGILDILVLALLLVMGGMGLRFLRGGTP